MILHIEFKHSSYKTNNTQSASSNKEIAIARITKTINSFHTEAIDTVKQIMLQSLCCNAMLNALITRHHE